MSNVLKKTVKVYPTMPVHINKELTITRAMESAIEMTVGNIERCMLLGAKVFEVLEDGTEIMLYNNNYKKDNSKLQKTLLEKKIEAITPVSTAVEKKENEEPVTPPVNTNVENKEKQTVTPPVNIPAQNKGGQSNNKDKK